MRMTLDETWKNCLSMERWIAKQKRNGSRKYVSALKREWLGNHQFEVSDLESENCFFCLYNNTKGAAVCELCPAVKVDAEFHCADESYNWQRKPIKFYNKLVSLNRKRLKAKK